MNYYLFMNIIHPLPNVKNKPSGWPVDLRPGKSRLAGTMPTERMADVDTALKMVLDLH